MKAKKTSKPKSEFGKVLEKMRENLPTSVVEVEISTKAFEHKKINQSFEHARIIRNTALCQVEKRFRQMMRTKIYRNTLINYGQINEKISNCKDDLKLKALKKEKNEISDSLNLIQIQFGVTEPKIQDDIIELRKKYNRVQAVIGQKLGVRVWESISTMLFGNSENVHYRKVNEFCSIEGKQNERCIMLKKDTENQFYVSYLGMKMFLMFKKDDLFVKETFSLILNYMNNGKEIDEENYRLFMRGLPLKSTYRVKYNRIVRKEIRGQHRFFLQAMIEGLPVNKRKKDGSFRHTLGKGTVGTDIGAQSLAVSCDQGVFLKNLAERTANVKKERSKVLAKRAIQRSREKTNPHCFDQKGRFIKGRKITIISKRYKKKRAQLRNLERICAENRMYAHNQDVNWLRSLGDHLITEPSNAKALQKKAKNVTINEKTGKYNKRKRFGKSILKRSPGYFFEQLKYRFNLTGGTFQTVDGWSFKASQYDHMLDESNKKQLSQRWHVFENKVKVQRDCYSAFLLECSNSAGTRPVKLYCDTYFNRFKKYHDDCIDSIKKSSKRILNSGIK